MSASRLFSGIQPSGMLHIGNYLGAIAQWVALQRDHGAIFCVVDLHAITVPQDPAQLRRSILDVAKWYIAAGIDPRAAIVFVQSDVPAHAEFGWLLNTIARMGDLEKMTQFKDKSGGEGATRATVGLFDYPVLMAADILLYGTDVVPVGEDQIQHVELTRDLAKRWNARFGDVLRVPDYRVVAEGARIMGLDDPLKKMSKSAVSAYNYIALTDDADTIRKKVRKAVTDSGSAVVYADDKPALRNLINIYHLVTGDSILDIVTRYAGRGYGDFKADVAEAIIAHLAPIQERFAAISDDDIRVVLQDGAARANAIAAPRLATIKTAMGLGRE